MTAPNLLHELVAQRDQVRRELDTLGDFRAGTLSRQRVKCGKPNCRCARAGEAGHPRWILTRTVAGKTHSWSVPARAVETIRKQVETYKRFRALAGEWADISSRICEEQMRRGEPGEPEKRGRLRKRLRRKSARN